jgi:hypothetical protein
MEVDTNSKEEEPRMKNTKNQATPEEIADGMPIGVAMDAFLKHASPDDIQQVHRIYDVIVQSIDPLRSEGITGHQVTIAALNFARVMLLAQAEHADGIPDNLLRFPGS